MKFKFLLATSLLTILISCSSDPCEDTVCGIGTCVEGTCDCPPGYYGPSCEDNYFGIYAASLMNSNSCPGDFPIPVTTRSPLSAGERICYPFMGGQQCFFYRIELNSDMTYRSTFNQIAVAPGGTEALVSSAFPTGTYSLNNEKLILNFDNGVTQELEREGNILNWDISQATDGFPNCILQVEFTLLDE